MLPGEISDLTSTLQALKDSLAGVEDDLKEVADAANGDVAAIAAQAEEIEEKSTQALRTGTAARDVC